MRLLILSIQFAPEITSNAAVITGLAQALAARGHQVTVLAGTPHYRLPHVPAGYLFRPFRRESRGGVKIVRCWAFPKSDGKVSKLLNYVSFTLTSFLASLFTWRPGAMLVVSPPFWLGFNALLLKALRRCPVIYNAQDLFPEAYLASGEVRAGRLTHAMSCLMTRIYRRCDRITVITDSFADAIAAKGIDPRKIVSIPNFVDTSAIAPLPRSNSFSRRWGLDDKFVVMYAGNIGYTHGTELLVEAAEKLAPLENVRFLVIGGGSKQADLERLARERRLANMQFLPTQPSELLPEMLASADVFVLTTKPGVGKTSFPGRIYSFLLAARPVIASVDRDSDLAQLLCEAGAGIVTAPGNAGDFSQALATLYHDASARERLAQKGREFMEHHYSPNAVVEQYDELLKRLVAR
ncbi:MAG: glycosyltransferase family 4 protein [Terriglobia bacterium]